MDSVTVDELLAILRAKANQKILQQLAQQKSYPRAMAAAMSMDESEVSRRMKRMEDAGILASEWHHNGKTVKMYKLASDAICFTVKPQGLTTAITPIQV